MLKKAVLPLFFFIFSINVSHIAYANEELVFGPETFIREKEKPKKEIREFQVTNPSGLYRVEIINGKAENNTNLENDEEKNKKNRGKKSKQSKKHRVTSAGVWLNGLLIAKSSDLKKHVATITRDVPLENKNILEVKLKGKPGSQIIISICCEESTDPPNQQPIADAGSDQTVNTGTTVTLNGSSSTDPDGDSLTYQWSIQSSPAGSLAEISDSNIVNPTITPDLVGDYVIQLIVNDGILSSVPSSITITAQTPMVTVPNVVGMAQASAESTITAAYLLVGTITTAYSDTVPAGDVISQNPATGTSVAEGSSVDLLVSLGPDTGTLPPDPETVAPELDQTVATTMAAATEFLYTGDNPIQTGVAPGAIEPKRVAVLRGKILERDGITVISGVTITILNHPEYGSTLSREDGFFDMAVNGGGVLVVRYEKDGYITAQRKVNAPWQDYAWIEDVVMVPYDPIVTVIDFSEPMQVAMGSVETDNDGSRQAILLFPQGTTASMTFPDGTTQPLTILNVRATEFTVGENGPQAMPAKLPPASAYTYAVEFSVDEAVNAGATEVTFSQPIINYTENYLGMPVGMGIPVGYYDRETGAWVPSDNGRIVEILSINGNNLVELDIDGSGIAADQMALDNMGITDAERQRLAELYQPGQSLWRVLITHFTPWDCGGPGGPPGDAELAAGGVSSGSDSLSKPCYRDGSIIECQNQTLGESVDITGTPFSLNYRSDRVPGRVAANRLEIPLSSDSVPVSLTGIELEIYVAGRRFTESYITTVDPNIDLVNLNYTFTWDGNDAYGRAVQGVQTATVRIGYTYPLVYQQPAQLEQSFAVFSGVPFTSRPGVDVTLWQEEEVNISGWNGLAQGLGGWNINVQHAYDPVGRILYLGTGKHRRTDAFGKIISTVAGNGDTFDTGDGGLATEAGLSQPNGVALGPDGSLYIAVGQLVRRVDPNGIITTIAGGGNPPDGLGDGGLATDALLYSPSTVAIGPDGSLYIVEYIGNRVRKVDTDGIITTVAGDGTPGYSGDEGPATDAQLRYPWGVAVDEDGSIYIADYNNHRVRKVSPDGIIITIAGNGTKGYLGEGGPAAQAELYYPSGVALGPDGSIYIAEWDGGRVLRITPDGIINRIAGGGASYGVDGIPATEANLVISPSVAVARDGSFYIAEDANRRVRIVDQDGIINTLAGSGSPGYSGDGGLATMAQINRHYGIALGPDGSLYIADSDNYRIRKIAPDTPGFSATDIYVASENGDKLYSFDSTGRHLRTINTLTGADIYNFTYDASGFLTQIEETGNGSNNITIIERDSDGNPTAIIAPDGQRTGLTLNVNGYLDSITDPENNTTYFSYSSDGLMETLIDPNNKLYIFTYDPLTGRLIKDENPAGGSWDLVRTDSTTDNSYTVDLTSAMERKTTYLVENQSTGDQRRLVTNPMGLLTETLIGTDGSRTTTVPDGTITSILEGPDPRWSMQSPIIKNMTITTPADGLIYSLTSNRTATLSNPDDPLSLTTQTDTININSRTYTSVFDASTNRITSTTPESRQTTATIDSQGRVLQEQIDNTTLYPVDFIYDTRGRLDTITRGTTGVDLRETKITYYASGINKGFIKNITDPMQRTVTFEYDLAGKVKKQILPDLKEILYDYDANGNVTSITPPGRPVHQFTYTAINLQEDYIPPEPDPANPLTNRITNYQYNFDKQLDLITRPDGQTIDFIYDPIAFGANNGLLDKIVIPRGEINYDYYSTTGNLKTITAPDLGSLTFTYDGSLLKNSTWAGTVSGSISRTYDNNFWITSRSVNGGNTINYLYDDDGLLTQAGSLTLVPNPNSGLLSGTTLNNVTDTVGYNSFGELESYSASFSGSEIYSVQYPNRDSLGRITQKIEAISGQNYTYDYDYYISGRLKTVTKDGIYVVQYDYDDNGNRLSHITPGPITTSGVYDDQDRLTSYGNFNYSYTDNGELLTKTDTSNNQTTTYNYDVLGNLVSVSLPVGNSIEYIIDGLNRRIGKKVNGTLVQGFLYKDQLNPIAELDGSGSLVARFVYGSKFNVPDYIIKGGVTYRIISDHLGSPRIVIDTTTGTIVQQIEYDEFGNIETDTNPGFQPFGFAGGIYDQDTGLTRFGARDYDAYTGRWSSKDPIRFAGGDTNLYGYVLNDPINFIDPLGLELTTAQQFVVSAASATGAVLGGTVFSFAFPGIGTAGGAVLGSSLFGAAAASLLGGDIVDQANATLSGGASTIIAGGIAKLTLSLSRSSFEAAVRTGLATGVINSILMKADPIFADECSPK